MTADPKKIIDWAPSKDDAIVMRDLYRHLAHDINLGDWLFGYEEDPVPFAGRHGYRIYAVPKPPEQRKPGDDGAIEPSRVIPPQQVRRETERRVRREPK